MKRNLLVLSLAVFAFVSLAGPMASAQDEVAQFRVPWYQKPFIKLGRGCANVLTCPLEFVHQTKEQWFEQDHTVGGRIHATVTGVLLGGVKTGHRLVAGAYDIVTFPFPKYEWTPIDPPTLPGTMPLPTFGPRIYDVELLPEIRE